VDDVHGSDDNLGCHDEANHISGGLPGKRQTVARFGANARLVVAGADNRRPSLALVVAPVSAAADKAAGRNVRLDPGHGADGPRSAVISCRFGWG